MIARRTFRGLWLFAPLGLGLLLILLRRALLLLPVLVLLLAPDLFAAGELRFALPFEPKTLEPNLATDEASAAGR